VFLEETLGSEKAWSFAKQKFFAESVEAAYRWSKPTSVPRGIQAARCGRTREKLLGIFSWSRHPVLKSMQATSQKVDFFIRIYYTFLIMLTTRKKLNILKAHQRHETDTGSPEVQISILGRRIEELASHLKKNKKDNHSRRGLLKMVSKRKKLLDYLSKKNPKAYNTLVRSLGLKK